MYPETLVGRLTLTKPVTSETAARVLTAAAVVLLVPATLAGLAALAVRLRRAAGLVRKQVLLLLLVAGTLLLVSLLQGMLGDPAGPLVQAVR